MRVSKALHDVLQRRIYYISKVQLSTSLACYDRHGYLSELPQREYLPLFWTKDERSLLRGTEAEHRPQEDILQTREDFITNVLPLVNEYPEQLAAHAFTLDNFRIAASWVASRAFGVDSYHGMTCASMQVKLKQALLRFCLLKMYDNANAPQVSSVQCRHVHGANGRYIQSQGGHCPTF